MNRRLVRLLILAIGCWATLSGSAGAAHIPAGNRLLAVRPQPGGAELVLETGERSRRLYKIPATRFQVYPGQRQLSDTAVSADGRRALVFQVGARPYHALIEVNLESGRSHPVGTRNRYGEHPAFLRDADIVFSSPAVRKPPGSNIAHDHPGGTYLLDPRKGTQRLLFARQEIAVSPGGRRFLARDPGGRDLLLLNRSGHILRRVLPRRSHGTYLSEAAFSPDGREIVFVERSDPTADGVLYASSADGTHARRLTLGLGSASDPSFSPDGRTVVYVKAGEGDGSGEVWALPLRRPAAARRLTRESGFEFPALLGE
jgi:dipeptidyl aminopeptidase/acylaminoacyl peptidase